jgi:hypothetical protein
MKLAEVRSLPQMSGSPERLEMETVEKHTLDQFGRRPFELSVRPSYGDPDVIVASGLGVAERNNVVTANLLIRRDAAARGSRSGAVVL